MLNVIGQPLFEAAAQTLIGAIAGYSFDKIKGRFYRENTFDGPFDFWQRGIHHHGIQTGDSVSFDGLISPYVQLFPRDPYTNATRWNSLHNFDGKLTAQEFSQMEFYAGSDDAIRTGPLNGETVIGLYNRYGYIGEGVLGVVATSYLRKCIPDFFAANFWGCRARISGRLAYCPAQHGFVAQGMFEKAGIHIDTDSYKEIPYIKVSSIKLFHRECDTISSLLGTAWAATDTKNEPYILQYGYFSEPQEMSSCAKNMVSSSAWDSVKVYYDTITAPSETISFKNAFIG